MNFFLSLSIMVSIAETCDTERISPHSYAYLTVTLFLGFRAGYTKYCGFCINGTVA